MVECTASDPDSPISWPKQQARVPITTQHHGLKAPHDEEAQPKRHLPGRWHLAASQVRRDAWQRR